VSDNGDNFGKPIPCPPGAYYIPSIAMPRPVVRPRELTPEERAARRKATEQVISGAAAFHLSLLDAGMKDWLERAKQKWLRAGGYGCALTPEEEEEIRAAGFVPAKRDH
jgi:hypothetical protein